MVPRRRKANCRIIQPRPNGEPATPLATPDWNLTRPLLPPSPEPACCQKNPSPEARGRPSDKIDYRMTCSTNVAEIKGQSRRNTWQGKGPEG
jgi:hypothetical protein